MTRKARRGQKRRLSFVVRTSAHPDGGSALSLRQACAARKRVNVAAAIQPRWRIVNRYLTIGNAMTKFSSMRRVVPAFALIALAGSTSQLRAHEQCPELTR